LRCDTKENRSEDIIDDSKLCVAIANELSKYNCIVTWNGKQFDVPFLNARLAKYGFPAFKPQFHIDLMYYAGGVSMRIGSRKLLNVQKFLGLEDEKTDMKWETWQLAATGNKKAMDSVVEHCEQDVKVLAQAYDRMINLVANIHA
jgi:uncharacterized protein YprB with RNaseH-like and TPR domain